MNELEWTGERLITSVESELKIEHLHRYGIASFFTPEKIVLDIACGEGYGVDIIAGKAKYVYGVDISNEAINHAKLKYKSSNIEFLTGSVTKIPLLDSSVDVVTSFETLEHLKDHNTMLTEIKRVLKSNGILIISTPDKKTYSDDLGIKNDFHVKELYHEEFKKLVSTHFSNYSFLHQRVLLASFIIPEKTNSGFIEFFGDYEAINQKINSIRSPLYTICIASDTSENTVFPIPISVFNDSNLLNSLLCQAEDRYRNSFSYRLGHVILAPFKFLYRLFYNRS